MKIIRITLYCYSLLILSGSWVPATDRDLKKEEALHRIYRQFHSQPTAQEVWQKALERRASQQYTIVKGDTLWDISRTLFDDGFFWSKVWSLNPYITNPHQISVGQVIQFYPGTGLEGPGLVVKSETAAPAATPLTPETPLAKTKWWKSEGMASVEGLLDEVTLPPPTKDYPRALDVFPPSLPNWYFHTDSEIDKAPLEIIPVKQVPIVNILRLPFFISEYPQEIKGTVFEIEKNAKTASERDFLFIDADEALRIGQIYTVIQKMGRIKDPESFLGYPYSYEVQGEIRIVDRIEDLYKAVVIRSLFPVQVGAEIIPGESPKMNLSDPGEPSSIRAMVIGGENDTTRSLFGPQSIVFINRGFADGVRVNQTAPIYAMHRLRHSESSIFSNTWKVGDLKVVKVDKNFATAVIMDATETIITGDIVGSLKPSDINETFKKIDSNYKFGFDDEHGGINSKGRRLRDRESRDQGSGDRGSREGDWDDTSESPSDRVQGREVIDDFSGEDPLSDDLEDSDGIDGVGDQPNDDWGDEFSESDLTDDDFDGNDF